jgi:hypothetical protein
MAALKTMILGGTSSFQGGEFVALIRHTMLNKSFSCIYFNYSHCHQSLLGSVMLSPWLPSPRWVLTAVVHHGAHSRRATVLPVILVLRGTGTTYLAVHQSLLEDNLNNWQALVH